MSDVLKNKSLFVTILILNGLVRMDSAKMADVKKLVLAEL